MKIVISFAGGSLDNCILSGDSENRTPAGEVALTCYGNSGNGRVGYRFKVPRFHDHEIYEVVKRLKNDNCIIVRAKLSSA